MVNCIQVLIPLPNYGFDPTEVAIPWQILHRHGVRVLFATPAGGIAEADRRMLDGEDLGIWKWLLQASADAQLAYHEMIQQQAFKRPLSYADITAVDFDGLLLPGGHDKGVKEYLESDLLQQVVAKFFDKHTPVAAICHGVVLAARSKGALSGKSVLHGYRTTALLRSQEMAAYHLTRLWLGDYYLTYPGLTVQKEVTEVLRRPEDFEEGPIPLLRDSMQDLNRGFIVRDRNYVSARWPGDAHAFAMAFLSMLKEGGNRNNKVTSGGQLLSHPDDF